MKNKSFFFDLDGTLLDTAPDFYEAMLKTMEEFGSQRTINFSDFRPSIFEGTNSMLHASMKLGPKDPNFKKVKRFFLRYYGDISTEKTDYFPGILETLESLDQEKISWGIVTNKPTNLTLPILEHFKLMERSCCVVSGDTIKRRKPDPDTLIHACKISKKDPKESYYFGDTETDVKAAKAAGMVAIAVTYGYHQKHHPPSVWGADHLISCGHEILSFVHQLKCS